MAVHFNTLTPAVGTVTVTDIPFEPVAVMFFAPVGIVTRVSQMFGATSGTAENWAIWMGIEQETSGYTGRSREIRDDACIYLRSQDQLSVQVKGALDSFTSDGFVVDFSVASGSQPIRYMAVGGGNIFAAQAGTFTEGGATGTFTVTGLGFDPDALVVGHVAAGTVNTHTTGGAAWALGFTAGTGQQHANAAFASSGSATGGFHQQRTDSVSVFPGGHVMELDSFGTGQFTLDVTTAGSDYVHGYLAIDAAAARVGTNEFPDTTGVVSYATQGLEPGGVLFAWNGADTPSSAGTAGSPLRPGVGAMDGPDGPFPKLGASSMSGHHRGTAPFGSYQPDQVLEQTEAVHIVGVGSQVDPGAFTMQSGGEFNLFELGAFELNWTTATTNTREFGWLALPGKIVVPWIPQVYRRMFTTSGGMISTSALLLESGDRLLLEDGSGALLL